MISRLTPGKDNSIANYKKLSPRSPRKFFKSTTFFYRFFYRKENAEKKVEIEDEREAPKKPSLLYIFMI